MLGDGLQDEGGHGALQYLVSTNGKLPFENPASWFDLIKLNYKIYIYYICIIFYHIIIELCFKICISFCVLSTFRLSICVFFFLLIINIFFCLHICLSFCLFPFCTCYATNASFSVFQ